MHKDPCTCINVAIGSKPLFVIGRCPDVCDDPCACMLLRLIYTELIHCLHDMYRFRALAADESNGSTATYHDLYDYHYTSTGRITTTATSSHYPTDDRRGSRHLPSVPQVSPGLLPPRPRKERSRAAVEYVSARAIYAARCSSTDGDVTGRTSSSHSESNRGPYRGGDIAFSKATGTSSGGYDTALSDAEFRAFRSSLARALDRWDARLHSSVARAWAGTDARTSLYRIEPTSASSSTSSGGSTSSSISTSSSGGMAVPQSPLLHYVYSEPETLSLGDIPRYACCCISIHVYIYIYIYICVYIYMYIYMYFIHIYMHNCMYVHIVCMFTRINAWCE
jgi:hypothetical protein